MIQRIKDKLSPHVAQLKYDLWKRSDLGVTNSHKLLGLKEKYTGKRCFIFANGPSLLKCDLSLLKNEITIASNGQFLLWDELGYKPTFFTIEDELVAEGRKEVFSELTGTNKIFPFDLKDVLKANADTVYINFVRKYKDFPAFTESFQDKVYWGGTVSFLNLQLAYYLGCSEIYLIGFDHSFNVPASANNTVITAGESSDGNHFHPDYWLKGQKWYDPNVDRMTQAYVKANEFLTSKGIKVYNVTVGGKLEVFERIDYKNLF